MESVLFVWDIGEMAEEEPQDVDNLQSDFGYRQYANEKIRGYIVGIVVFGFVVYGPIPDAWYGLLFRLAYLIGAGVVTWFVLKWIWKSWLPDPNEQYKFALLVVGLTAGVFLAVMAQEMIAETHWRNTEYAGHYEDPEPVGEWYEAEGPDMERVAMWGLCLFAALWAHHNCSHNDYVSEDEKRCRDWKRSNGRFVE